MLCLANVQVLLSGSGVLEETVLLVLRVPVYRASQTLMCMHITWDNLVKMQILIRKLGRSLTFCISNQLPGCANAQIEL